MVEGAACAKAQSGNQSVFLEQLSKGLCGCSAGKGCWAVLAPLSSPSISINEDDKDAEVHLH